MKVIMMKRQNRKKLKSSNFDWGDFSVIQKRPFNFTECFKKHHLIMNIKIMLSVKEKYLVRITEKYKTLFTVLITWYQAQFTWKKCVILK